MHDSGTDKLFIIRLILVLACSLGGFLSLHAHTPTPKNQVKVEALLAQSRTATNASQAVAYAEQAVFLADSLGLNHLKADALHQSGISWKLFGDQLKSGTRLQEAIKLYGILRLHDQVYKVRMDLGETYRSTRNYLLSVENLYASLSHFKKRADSTMLAEIYNRLAATYYEMLFSHPDYVHLNEKGIENKTVFLESLIDLPEIKNYYENTVRYLDSSYYIANSLGLDALLISNVNIEAGLYTVVNEPFKALELYNALIDTINKTGVTDLLPLVYTNKARLLGINVLGRPLEAIEMALEALEMAKAQEINIYVFLAHVVLHDNYYAIGDYKNAFSSLNTTRELLQQFNHERIEILTQTQLFEHQIAQRELELQAGRDRIVLMAVSLIVIMLVFSVFIFVLSGKNRKQRSLLEQLQQKNQIITGQNELLSITNTEKDKFFSIIAHDLRHPFQSLLGISELLKENEVTLNREEIKELADLQYKSATRTMTLLDDLLDWARLQQGRISFNPEVIAVGELMDFVSELLKDAAAKKDIRILSELTGELSVEADKEMLKTLLRNLVSNAVKFSHPGGEVVVTATTVNGFVKISVSDKGIGIPKDKIDSLFRIDNTHIMSGTANEKGTGLGLVLCREFVEKHGGKIWVVSEENEGSVFSFTLPAGK